MMEWSRVAAVACAAGVVAMADGRGRRDETSAASHAVLLRQTAELRATLTALDTAAATGATDTARVRAAFRAARIAYKTAEWWLATDSTTAAALNAPVVDGDDDLDDEEDSAEALARGVKFTTPVGLQAVEALIFPTVGRGVTWPLRDALGPAHQRLIADPASDRWSDAAVFDAARTELVRIESVGLADVDSPIARNGLRESAAALDGLRDALAPYRARAPAPWATLDGALERAAAALRAAPSSDRLDRLAFLTHDAFPLDRALRATRDAIGVPPTVERSLWRATAVTLLDSNAFDPWAFAPPDAPAPTRPEVSLGRTLFSDPTLGGASLRSCATCHQPARAFTDGLRHSRSRVTPTLLGAALQPGMFADLRARTLEDQVNEVIANREEMAGIPVDSMAHRLAKRPPMAARFAEAFGGPAGRDAVTAQRLRWALAAYERTLVRLDSPFDRALRGDSAALASDARRGFTVFMGRGRCGTCHFFPLFGGTTPPAFAREEVEVLGTPRTATTAHAEVDQDFGRYRVTYASRDLYAFRVPTVRNAAVTGPYMHNGVYRTLDQVVDFYDRGGGDGIGARLPNQTLPLTRLHLTTGERHDLVAFLRSLTD